MRKVSQLQIPISPYSSFLVSCIEQQLFFICGSAFVQISVSSSFQHTGNSFSFFWKNVFSILVTIFEYSSENKKQNSLTLAQAQKYNCLSPFLGAVVPAISDIDCKFIGKLVKSLPIQIGMFSFIRESKLTFMLSEEDIKQS